MKLRRICKSAAAGVFAAVLSASGMASEPLLTKSTSFRIPFTVDTQDSQSLSGYAVLYGSKDGGPMQELQRVDISAGGFEFAASSDGLWAFAIRMTDRTGIPDPADGRLQPSLRVLVDSTAPTLNLDLADNRNGTVQVRWQASQESVPGSMQLEYAEGTNGRWQPLPANSPAAGQTTIQSRPGTSIAVRGKVSDRAGNVGESRQDIITTVPPAPSAHQSQQFDAPPQNPVYQPPAAPVGRSPFPAHQRPVIPMDAAPQQSLTPSMAPTSVQNGHTPQAAHGQQPGILMPTTANPAFNAAPRLVSSQTVSPNAYQMAAAPLPGVTPPSAIAPPSVQRGAQLVSDAVFNVDYTVEDVGPSGLSSVEMFITENGGQKWFAYGNDTDMQSPMLVDVQGEGTFGFAIRVRNGVGFIDPPPQPGDRPEIVITVDQTAPELQFAAPQVRVQGNPHVHLDWNIQDVQATSVRLEWATSSSGPWIPVFDWQRDPARFDWPIQPNSPHSVHFRLLARDAAGNVGSAQTSQPVLIDLKRPKARMLGVQPAARSLGY